MDEIIRILIVDDHPIVRIGLRALIDSESDMEVVGEAANGIEAVAKASFLRPQIILLDIVMPRMDGITAIKEILQEYPEARILVFTSYSEDKKVFSALRAGALGYLLKDSDPKELIQAIREVSRGGSPLHPVVARKLINELNKSSESHRSSDSNKFSGSPEDKEDLTDREMEILKLIARGLTNMEIADLLVISERTVRVHVGNILNKLQVSNRTQAALYALRKRLVDLADE